MPQKPDRFERAIAEKAWGGLDTDVKGMWGTRKGIWAGDAVNLLRKEHAWIERLLRKHAKYYLNCAVDQIKTGGESYTLDRQREAILDVLAVLKLRRK